MYIQEQDITVLHNFYASKITPFVESKGSYFIVKKHCICKMLGKISSQKNYLYNEQKITEL